MWSALGKYKSIVVSIALFLLLDASVLILNFYISFKIADDAVSVNLAGRQRMLSQRTVKSLLDLQISEGNTAEEARSLDELKKTSVLFNATLNAFERGGSATGADGSMVSLQPAKTETAKAAVAEAKMLWKPYYEAIQAVLDTDDPMTRAINLEQAISYAKEHNLVLLGLMNRLTIDLEATATQQATTLRYVQAAGITLAIINFFIILFHFIGELKRNDKALERARKETTDILNTVNEGLFLLDQELIVGSQYSAQLQHMFGNKPIAHEAFSDLIGGLVKPKDLETAQRFIGLLFRPDIKSNLITDLNPLNEVEINLPNDKGGYITLYLSFQFSRVMLGDEIENILVTVNDITQSVKLANQLAEEKQKSEQQLEMLTSILHANPKTLKRFIQNAFDTFEKINALLKDQTKTDAALKRKLNEMFIEAHNFKGDASAHGLESFADYAHDFEADIHSLKNKEKVSGNDFLSLTVKLEKLISYTESVKILAEKLASFSVMKDEISKSAVKSDEADWSHLDVLVDTVAQRSNKKVQLITTGFGETDIDNTTRKLISDLCIQLIRNAITHSVEPEEERLKKGKPPIARIDARLVKLPNGQLELSVRDDGNGIDYEKIRARAKQMKRWNDEMIGNWNHQKLLGCIFEEGFSTAPDTSKDAGRGVGMNVIKQRIRSKGGTLRIANKVGMNCMFTAVFPPALSEKTGAVA